MSTQFWIGPPELNRSEDIVDLWIEEGDFVPLDGKAKRGRKPAASKAAPYVLVGFDTEFKTPGYAVSRQDIKDGLATSIILSYQFYAKASDGRVWSGICCPKENQRLTLQEFLLFVFGMGARREKFTDMPRQVYLVGHFTRADLPAFADFQEISKYVSAVRNTFISIDSYLNVNLQSGSKPEPLKVLLRDTMLLSPQSAKSLKSLGDLVGVPKVELSPDRATYLNMIRNMDQLRREQWDLFRRYALTDAEICVHYIEQVMSEYKAVTGNNKVPVTLTSIGVDKLKIQWSKLKLDMAQVLGKEEVVQRTFDKRRGYYSTQKTLVPLPFVHYHMALATDCYHGGRNEQFWFGPGFEDDWSDLDLSSAYPTAMSLINMPAWDKIRVTTDVSEYTATALGYARLRFEFPENTRYPTLPVRTSHGLIFPLSGVTECPAPEIYLAVKLGAKVVIEHGVVVPVDSDKPVFTPFIQECLKLRMAAGKNTLRGLFWKEISNSTYGKTAQGLHERRVYDLRERSTQLLPESTITNAYFAAFITSFVRATLGEVLNSLPPNKMAFSCTTDGFLANLSDEEIQAVSQGEFCSLFRQQRKMIAGDDTVLEKKHYIRKPLGWRTRGQATLKPGVPEHPDGKHVLLARGGVWVHPEFEETHEQNDEIIRLFMGRTPETIVHIEGKTGIRDIVEQGTDFVDKAITKRLSMEFDWKRRPHSCAPSTEYDHLVFSTSPWNSLDQFSSVRDLVEKYQKTNPSCFKTMGDLEELSNFVEVNTSTQGSGLSYLRSDEGDIKRLRQSLCEAFKHEECGLEGVTLTNPGFATVLTRNGIPCKKTDVENGLKTAFIPNRVPPTKRVMVALGKLRGEFWQLDIKKLLSQPSKSDLVIRLLARNPCQFIDKVV